MSLLLAPMPFFLPMSEQGTSVPAAPVATEVTAEMLLAFENNDTRMTVPVTIGTTGPHRFIVDTGAERTVISRELAGRLGLARGRTVKLTAMTGTSSVDTVVIPAISVAPSSGGIAGAQIEAPALEARHLGAPGILGIDTLQGRAVMIDFDRKTMAVTRATKRDVKPIASASDEIVVKAKSVLGQLVVTEAFYGKRRIRVVLDTGSVATMGNPALQRLVSRGTRSMRPIQLLGVTGMLINADYTQVNQVRIGGVTLANLPVAFADAAPFRRFGLVRQPALLLGMDTLRLFRRVKIDFANREVRMALPRNGLRAL